MSLYDEALRAAAAECDALKADRDRLRKVLEDIASGEIGINLCIKYAKQALQRPDGDADGR